MIYVRYAGTPSTATGDNGAANDVSGKGNARLDVPRPGTYFLLVVATEAKANITLAMEDCSKSNMTAGPGCKVPYIDSAVNPYLMNILDSKFSWRYWKVTINENHTELWASVRSDSGLNLPSIYAAQGNLPTTDSYTIMNCNFEYCDGAHIIYMNFTDAKENPQVWYIGTFTNIENNTYGVWFDSVCAQECTEQNTGTCQDTAPDYGKCVCATSSLTGVDCTISKYHHFPLLLSNLVLTSLRKWSWTRIYCPDHHCCTCRCISNYWICCLGLHAQKESSIRTCLLNTTPLPRYKLYSFFVCELMKEDKYVAPLAFLSFVPRRLCMIKNNFLLVGLASHKLNPLLLRITTCRLKVSCIKELASFKSPLNFLVPHLDCPGSMICDCVWFKVFSSRLNSTAIRVTANKAHCVLEKVRTCKEN
jgi:hypothetical protein